MKQITRVSSLTILILFFNSIVIAQKYNHVEIDTVLSLDKVIICHSIYTVNENTIWADFASEMHRSLDAGESWENITIPETDRWTSLRPLNTDTAFFSVIYSGFYKTTDGGETWENMNIWDSHPHHFHFFDGTDGILIEIKLKIKYVSIWNFEDTLRIWKTSDGGYNWIEVNEPDRPAFIPGEQTWHYANNMNRQTIGDTIFFGTTMGRVFRSYDRGNTWEAFYTGLGEDQFIRSIAQHNTKNMFLLSNNPFKTSFTDDGGITWTTFPLEYGYSGVAAIPMQDSSFVLLKGVYTQSKNGLFITHDGGKTISKLLDIPCHTISFINDSIAVMPTTYINQSGGPYNDYILRLTFSFKEDTTGIREIKSYQINIYPNPTTNLLTIETEYPDHYSIEITSMNGQQILVGEMEGTSQQIDLSSFQKGVYSIIVRSKDFIRTEMIIKL